MELKDKLRVGICMSQSKSPGFIYNTREKHKKLMMF